MTDNWVDSFGDRYIDGSGNNWIVRPPPPPPPQPAPQLPGFGIMPFGLGPFGIGSPVAPNDVPIGPAGSRYLNPVTRDYQQDPDSLQFAQMPPVRQRVLIAVMTIVGSSTALPKFGRVMPRIIGPTFEAELSKSIRASLSQMIDVEKVLQIDSLTIDRGTGGRYRITLQYTDLTTGLPALPLVF